LSFDDFGLSRFAAPHLTTVSLRRKPKVAAYARSAKKDNTSRGKEYSEIYYMDYSTV
jgi:hypothetical protein